MVYSYFNTKNTKKEFFLSKDPMIQSIWKHIFSKK